MEYIIASAISGLLALIGTVTTCLFTAKKTEQNIRINQAITDTKIEELTREVREHNSFATRVPVCEAEIENIKKDIVNLTKYHTP